MDFLRILVEPGKRKNDPLVIKPAYDTMNREDLMTRGGKFYALWDEDKKIWTKRQRDVIRLIDAELRKYKNEHEELKDAKILFLRNSESGSIDEWKRYCEKQLDDYFEPLDRKIIFSNMEPKREDFATMRLNYSLAEGPCPSWDELVGTLYSPEERHKIEWAIGSVVNGDSKWIQKFIVFYGSGGTGKSTILDIIKMLFGYDPPKSKGYTCVFSAKDLCSGSAQFALEPFKNNPLVAVSDDDDLSKIETNTRLNSLVSHAEMLVNQKYLSLYSTNFNAMLFIGTNRPVKITDSKSGVIRRLIDIRPSGDKIPFRTYKRLTKQVEFELGQIAWKCLQVYNADPDFYNEYVPVGMMGTNDIYNYVEDHVLDFAKKDMTTLSYAYTEYKRWCDESSIKPVKKYIFKEELMSYFKEFDDRGGTKSNRLWNVYSGFRKEKFKHLLMDEDEEVEVKDISDEEAAEKEGFSSWIKLDTHFVGSSFDIDYEDQPAQYAVDDGHGGDKPKTSWNRCKTKLRDIDIGKLHYVKVPGNLIMIDFDIRDPKTGEKSLELNIKAASAFPPTYAEVSKSGGGLHLYYIYDGDVMKLSSVYGDNIEVKVYPEDKLSSVRRMLTKCNDLPIATISSGLPVKEESKVINFEGLKDQTHLFNKIRLFMLPRDEKIKVNKNKGYNLPYDTSSSVDMIYKTLEEAWNSGMTYDIRNIRPDIISFAARSSHQSERCLKVTSMMHFCSKDVLDEEETKQKAVDSIYDEIVIFDCEVSPNRNGICYKPIGKKVVQLPNPTPEDIVELCKYKLIGFNNRRYDNHILFAKMLGYDEQDIYKLSMRIVNADGARNSAFFKEAYDLSYSDIYDFASKKQSLKKWEVELDIHHQENNIPWDKKVTDEEWRRIMDYCANDVVATEALFLHLEGDWKARLMLAEVAGMTPNDTTNQLTTKIIFEDDPHPQDQFVYTDLSEIFEGYEFNEFGIDRDRYLPGTKIVSGKSIYMGEDPGEGGYVYAEPGIYENVALLDIASMHPSSTIALNLFGDYYTKRYADLVDIRLNIKHGEFEEAAKLFGGKLARYLQDKAQAKQLSQALKIAINSVYGLTSAKFDNKFRDPRNVDNIVAKRGALFMIKLKHELQSRGYSVAHIKTDSIKIPNATPEVIQFVMDFGKQYGYTFEHEATYEKMCLVNEAVYIAKYADGEHEFQLPTGEKVMTPWTATGTQFQIPYVFKTLFSGHGINFRDLCETKSVSTALYLDFNEKLPEDQHNYVFVGKVGLFCPMQEGSGGGLLLREKDGKYSAATGTKGYRWMEAETVKAVGKEDQIDRRYYAALVDEAIATISEYGDFEAFAS